jgi:hypothetical protein
MLDTSLGEDLFTFMKREDLIKTISGGVLLAEISNKSHNILKDFSFILIPRNGVSVS